MRIEMLRSSTRKGIPGTVWSTRESICSKKFAQDDRVHIPRPKKNLQVKMLRSLPGNNEFVAYIDALGELDGTPCVADAEAVLSPLVLSLSGSSTSPGLISIRASLRP